jgi:hypothetical protein
LNRSKREEKASAYFEARNATDLFLGNTVHTHTYTYTHLISREKHSKLCTGGVRKEERVCGGRGPVLAPHSQVVAPDEALPARADIRVAIVVSQLDRLVPPTVAIPQVRRLRRPEMNIEALYPTWKGAQGAGRGGGIA